MSRLSLRARLVATLLAVATVGLVILAAVTYATQRDFLLDRVDEQARAAVPDVERAVADQRPGFFGGPKGHGFPGRPDRGDGPRTSLPPGTYGELRTAGGQVVGDPVAIGYADAKVSPPVLPKDLAADQLLTVEAENGELDYRVRTEDAFNGQVTTVVAIPLDDMDATLDRLLAVLALVLLAVLAAVGAAAWWLVGLGLRPLERIGATAGRIAGGRLDERVEVAEPRTEVGRLGLALNAMLARLESAFAERQASEDRLRRFLSDASHELRTPLASIRGYAELFRMGATADPGETEKAMRRIEEEAERMGVLVEDLLVLARLDEVREPVRERVDLGELAHDAVLDARATDPDRPIDGDGIGPDATVLGDAGQLRQVLGNLVRNALVHTPPGTPVQVVARRDGDEVLLEVRDRGPGLPDEDPDTLFDRFWRAEAATGRGRGKAGAGLGLAIVKGIVTAHGGTVAARNAATDGGGAVFSVRLPAL